MEVSQCAAQIAVVDNQLPLPVARSDKCTFHDEIVEKSLLDSQ